MGEGTGGGGQKRFGPSLVPLSFFPSHRGEGRFFKMISEKVRDEFSDFIV